MASSNSYNSPCAACKFLRRKCMPSCIFAPYFPPEEPQKFANVHKIFGASNVTKLLNDLLPHQREDAVNSLAYEAEARVRDPVYGCVGAISYLQRQVERLQKELDAANTDLIRFAWSDALPPLPQGVSLFSPRQRPIDLIISTTRHSIENFNEGIGVSSTNFHQTPCATFSFPSTIANNPNSWSSFTFDNSNSAGHVNIDGEGGRGERGGRGVGGGEEAVL